MRAPPRAVRVAGSLERVAVAGVLGLAILSGACSPAPATRPGGPPDVVLVVLDTVRADHLGAYGYERDTTPAIDRLALHSTRYRHAIASAPWTLPSHASLFTGLAPFEHGVHAYPPRATERSVRALGPGVPTLAGILRDHGYRTGAFVANALLNPHFGLGRGFETWSNESTVARHLNRSVFDWLDRSDDRPFFLFVNYIDAHRPYNTDGRRSFLEPPDPADRAEPIERLTRIVLPGRATAPPDLVARVIGEYDTAIASLDDAVDALLREIRSIGRERNVIFVVTSDHGEAFGEHGLVEHGRDVYQEMLAVPLIVHFPGQEQGLVDDRTVASEDVPRLILERITPSFAAALPPAPPGGVALAENHLTRSRDRNNPEWGFRFGRVRQAIFDGPFKLIVSSDQRDELYDLEHDPRELRNLVHERPQDAARLRRLLLAAIEQARAEGSDVEAAGPDAALREQLRALGYL